MNLISRQEFQNNFDQIQVLASKSHFPLSQLSKELIQISHELQQELLELINNDYKQFISLSYNLSGFDDIIHMMKEPLNSLLSNAHHQASELDKLSQNVQQKFIKRRELDDEIQLLKDCVQVDECIKKCLSLLQSQPDVKDLARIGIEYNQLEYLLSKGTDQAFLLKAKETQMELKNRVSKLLDEQLAIAFKTQTGLVELFGIYVSMDITANALLIFESVLLQPFVDNELIKYKPQVQQMSGHGDLFEKMYTLLHQTCYPIHQLSTTVKGFPNLLIHAWSYLSLFLGREFQMLFHVATPASFFEAYMTSSHFLEQLESLLGDDVDAFHSTLVYKEYMKKWQLSVYFQLIHNQVCSDYEQKLEEGSKGGVELMSALTALWDEKVVLKHLGHRFWRTSLLLLKRYQQWITDQIPSGDVFEKNHVEGDLSVYLTLLDSVSFVNSRLVEFVNTIVKERSGLNLETVGFLLETVGKVVDGFPTHHIKDLILEQVAQKTAEVFNHVVGVPAQFRRTNKPKPESPSFFMTAIFEYPAQFFADSKIEIETRREWSLIVVEKVVQKYMDKVTGTLSSMKKIEESLKRFKKNKKVTGDVSDEDKARLQLQIDCKALGAEIQKFGIYPKSVLSLDLVSKLIDQSLLENDQE